MSGRQAFLSLALASSAFIPAWSGHSGRGYGSHAITGTSSPSGFGYGVDGRLAAHTASSTGLGGGAFPVGVGGRQATQASYEGSVTPYRRTHIILDADRIVTGQDGFNFYKRAEAMGKTITDQTQFAVTQHPIGWTAKTYQENVYNIYEKEIGAAGIYGPVGAGTGFQITVPTAFKQVIMHRRNDDLPNATDGASDGLAANGDQFWQKMVNDQGTWWNSLTADFLGFSPPPALENEDADAIVVDRVGVTTDLHDPNQAILFRFAVPGGVTDAPHTIARLYFNGPARTINSQFNGGGMYCLNLYGDGTCLVEEKEATKDHLWFPVGTPFRYADANSVAQRTHSIYVLPLAKKVGNKYQGGSIVIKTGTTEALNHWFGNPQRDFWEPEKNQDINQKVFTITSKDPLPVIKQPIRVDLRRDIRILWQLNRCLYKDVGLLNDDVFALETLPTQDQTIFVRWKANVPDGTSINCSIYSSVSGTPTDGTLLTGVSNGKNWVGYKLDPTCKQYFAHFRFYCDSATQLYTPTLEGYEVIVYPTFTYNQGLNIDCGTVAGSGGGGVAITNNTIRSVSITGSEGDISHETAHALLEDPSDRLSLLRSRGQIPIRIETEYDPADSSKRSILFEGFITRCDNARKGTLNGEAYPALEYHQYDIKATGMWQKLSERWIPKRQNLARNLGEDRPYKVVEAIRLLFNWAGVSDYELDLPDADMLLSAGEKDLLIQPGTDPTSLITKLVNDYLGYYLVYDPNAGYEGMFRVLVPPMAPYTYKARFVTDGPRTAPGTNHVAVHNLNNYQMGWQGDKYIPTAFVRKHSLNTYVVPPEANFIVVTGKGSLPTVAGDTALTQTWINTNSYSASGSNQNLDPTDIDYLGRLVKAAYLDPALDSEEVINTVMHRLINRVGHGFRVFSFEAPLLLIVDKNDTKQTSPRPLRYYDPVLYNETPMLVRNVNPTYTKDHIQMAVYEIQTLPRVSY